MVMMALPALEYGARVGGVTHHMTGYAPVSKKALKGCVFQTLALSTFSFKFGLSFFFHHTLGVPSS